MSFWVGNLMLLVLNIPLIGLWLRLLSIPYHYLYPIIMAFVCIGAYSVNNSTFDVYVVMTFGAIGFGLRLLEMPPAPAFLGYVPGPMMEENLQRALHLSRGDFSIFVVRPISAIFLALTAALLAWALVSLMRESRPAESLN
jgi:TctA family transporter